MANDDIATLALELRDFAASFRATAVVACGVHYELNRGFGRGPFDPLIAGPEYVALLVSDRIAIGSGQSPSPDAIAEIARRYRHIFSLAHNAVDEALGEPTFDTLVSRLTHGGLTLRNLSVPQHWRQILQELAASGCDRIFEEHLGLSLSDCLCFNNACRDVVSNRYDEWSHSWRERADRLWRSRKGHAQTDVGDQHIIELATTQNRRTTRSAILQLCYQAAFDSIDRVFTITPDDVTTSSRMEYARAERILSALTYSEQPLAYRLRPSSRNALCTTPFFRLDETRYFLPHGSLLQWSILPRLEALLKAVDDRSAFQRYERIRSRFLEKTVGNLFGAVSDGTVVRNIGFEAEGRQYEIDVVARCDTTAYIIECKAATLSEATWRGAPKSVLHDLKRLLDGAARQVSRGCNAIESGALQIAALDGVKDLIPVVVTLDHLDLVSTAPQALANAGLTARPTWFISVTSLMSLVDLIESSWRFKHYCRRRMLVQDDRYTMAFTELDFFDVYCRFNICAFPAAGDHQVFVPPTDDASEYYFALDNGERAKKPAPPTPKEILDLALALERAGQIGWSDVVGAFLDWSYSAQKKVSTLLRRARQRATRGGIATTRMRDLESRWGIAYSAVKDVPVENALPIVQHGLSNEEETAFSWLLVLHELASDDVAFHAFVQKGFDWSPTAFTHYEGESGLFTQFEALPQAQPKWV